jgi:hypothetical protein
MSLVRRYCCALLAAIAAQGVDLVQLSAAEITAINASQVVLEGEIEPGDYAKLRNLVDPNADSGVGGDWFGDTYDDIYLASPGGSLLEAMKIGRLVRALRWRTAVPETITNPYVKPETVFKKLQLKNPKSNYMCASACFFIFVSGTYREAESGSQYENAILGIHRPSLTDSELRTISGDEAIASSNVVRGLVGDYLGQMNVPSKYADLMFSIPKDDIRWIDKAAFNADFNGDIPELKDWLDARCNKLTNAEKAFEKAVEDKSRSELSDAEKPIWDVLVEKWKAQSYCERSWRNCTRTHGQKCLSHEGRVGRAFRGGGDFGNASAWLADSAPMVQGAEKPFSEHRANRPECGLSEAEQACRRVYQTLEATPGVLS